MFIPPTPESCSGPPASQKLLFTNTVVHFFFVLRRQQNWDTHTQTHTHTNTPTTCSMNNSFVSQGESAAAAATKAEQFAVNPSRLTIIMLSCGIYNKYCVWTCLSVSVCVCVCVWGFRVWFGGCDESDRANGDKRAWGWKTRRGQAGRRADGLRFLDCSAAPQPATPMCSNWYSHSFSTLQLPSAPVLINLLYSLIYTQRGQTQGLETGRRCNIADGILSVLRLSRSRIYVQKCWEMMEISTTGLLLIIPIYSTVNG